jgi:hypothetical protein
VRYFKKYQVWQAFRYSFCSTSKQDQCASQSFFACQKMVCAPRIRFCPGEPLLGDAGLLFLGFPEMRHLAVEGQVCQKTQGKLIFYKNLCYRACHENECLREEDHFGV